MTNHWVDLKNSDVHMVCGSNTSENHPIAWKWVENSRDNRGAKVIVVDPRFTRTASKADIFSFIRPGTDITFFGGLINYAIKKNYIQWEYVQNYTNAPFVVDPSFSFDSKTGYFNGWNAEKGAYGPAAEIWKCVYIDPEKTKPKRVALIEVENMAEARGKPVGLKSQNGNWRVRAEDPLYSQTVFAKLAEHYSRYTPEMVEKVCGMPKERFIEIAETYCGITHHNDKSGNLLYAMGLTQSTVGSEKLRTFAVLQLLLGNTGLPGGGINALRGESNVQGSTDFGLLYHLLTGYLPIPDADTLNSLDAYNAAYSPDKIGGFWANRSKFIVSLLVDWWGDYAQQDLRRAFDLLPKKEKAASDYSHIPLFETMYAGKIKGLISWGQNPPVGGPNANLETAAMDKLDWYAAVDLWDTEAMNFWRRPGVNPKDIKTKVWALPAASSMEKSGSVSNSGRVAQFRWKAVEPPGEAKSDLWIVDQLMQRLKALYKEDKGAPNREAITELFWDYERDQHGEIEVENIGLEMGGFTWPTNARNTKDFWERARKDVLLNFAALKDDGSTACSNWIYGGIWAKEDDPGIKYAVENLGMPRDKVPRYKAEWQFQAESNKIYPEEEPLGIFPLWGFAWPLNRRIIYNRCSADVKGEPWAKDKALVRWNGLGWVTNDVPDFGFKNPDGTFIPPDVSAAGPFIMCTEKGAQVGRVFSAGMKEGPFPEHYEPRESPVKNQLNGLQNNPCIKASYPSAEQEPDKYGFAEIGDKKYPYVAITYRVTEHWQAGQMTRNLTWLGEAMPEMFVEISQELAKKLGIKKGNLVEVESVRGKVRGVAIVTVRLKPLKIHENGSVKEIDVVGMPWHFGYTGLFPGGPERGKIPKMSYAANQLTPHVGDANTTIPEYKAFLVNVRKVK